jgi:hypothetical protein
LTEMCESRTEKFVLGIGDVSRRLNRLMAPRGRDYPVRPKAFPTIACDTLLR